MRKLSNIHNSLIASLDNHFIIKNFLDINMKMTIQILLKKKY